METQSYGTPLKILRAEKLIRKLCPRANSQEVGKLLKELYPEELEGFRKWLREDPDIQVLEV